MTFATVFRIRDRFCGRGSEKKIQLNTVHLLLPELRTSFVFELYSYFRIIELFFCQNVKSSFRIPGVLEVVGGTRQGPAV